MQSKSSGGFLKTSLVYFLGSFLSKLALFFMLPLYTARIPIAEMGVYDATTAVAVLISSVMFLDVGVGVMRFFAARTDEGEGERILHTGLCLLFLLSFVYLLFCAALFLLLDVRYAPLAVLYGLLNALFLAAGIIVRAQGHAAWYATAGVISTLLQIACNLVLILGCRLGIASLYVSYIVGALVGVLLLLCRCRVRGLLRRGSVDRVLMRRLLRFCLPLGVSAAAYWVLTSLGRVAVTLFVDEAAGGAFAVSLKFAQIVIFASFCFRLAWQELAFQKGFDPNALAQSAAYYSARTDLFLRIIIALTLVLVPAARVALYLFPDFIASDYSEALKLIPVALVGASLTVFFDFLEPMFGAAKRTGYLMLSTALGALLNIVLILCVIACGGGAFGVHLAFLVAIFVTLLLRVVLLRRIVGLRLRLHYVAFLPLLAVAVLVYLHFSVTVNLFAFIAADLFGASLLFPALRQAIKRAKA